MRIRNNLCAFALRGLTIVLVAAGLGVSLTPASAVNFQMWVSADDDFDVYVGNATAATGTLLYNPTGGWATPYFLSATLPVNSYIYIPASDKGSSVWGLGGYTSTNGGTTWTPILASSPNWEVAYVDSPGPGGTPSDVMDLTTLNSWLSTNPIWVAPVAGTASAGFGLPNSYASGLPALGSIWTNLPGTNTQREYMRVVFRYKVVPEPASLFALGAGMVGLIGLKRRKR